MPVRETKKNNSTNNATCPSSASSSLRGMPSWTHPVPLNSAALSTGTSVKLLDATVLPAGETATRKRDRQLAISPGLGLGLGLRLRLSTIDPPRAAGAAAGPAASPASRGLGSHERELHAHKRHRHQLLLINVVVVVVLGVVVLRRELEGAPPLVGLLELAQQVGHGGGLDAAELGDD